MKVIFFFSLLVLLASASSGTAQASQTNSNPITEDGLMSLLANKIPRASLIRAVESHGVAFQLTSLFEQELTQQGDYLGKRGVAALLTAIRANFRPPALRPYRVTYRLLKGHAVDLLLEGKIGRWDKALDGKYFIVQNDVFNTLSDLVARFSEEFNGQKFVRIGGPRRTSRTLAAQYKDERKQLFVGSSGVDMIEYGKEDVLEARLGSLFSGGEPSITALINSLNDANENWSFSAFKQKRSDVLVFNRLARKSDLDSFESTLQKFYSYITRDYMPADFGVLQLMVDEKEEDLGGCGQHARAPRPRVWSASFTGPLLRTNVAIIENISSEPITVGRFILTENVSSRLEKREAVQNSLASRPPRKQYLFAPGILKPGESLVIPIELTLRMEKRDWEAFFLPDNGPANYYNDILSRARATKGLSFADQSGNKIPTVTVEALERIINKNKVDILPTTEYVYGPSVSIESLEINKYGYLVRKFDPSKLLITSGYDSTDGVGSCPYVYTYSARHNSWLSEGVILYGRNSRLKESTDEIALHRFNGRVLIEERDPEDSFIDSMYIRAESVDGKQTIIYPQDAKLRVADGDYLQLRQGDHQILEFPIPAGLTAAKYFLVASGYYAPYHLQPADRIRRRAAMQRFRAQ
jgi:hypothetical protein